MYQKPVELTEMPKNWDEFPNTYSAKTSVTTSFWKYVA